MTDTDLFRDLGLPAPLLKALSDVGYESPSPIQAATIPALLAGRDLVGQAQTGTGKTAAFALPILARLDIARAQPQALVLTPTRELAIQVAEAFQRYATHMPGFHVLPIYGGTGYGPQLGSLRRGVHVIVATPGRLIDHLDRGTISLAGLTTLVLDEADEMLRMGFVDDVEKILQTTPPGRQVALFSATMPAPIRRIANQHLKDPATVTIESKTSTGSMIRQRCWWVGGMHKLDALTRILEAEPFEAMIVFVRTKLATEELASKLEARGFAAAAINGDIAQQQRERTIERLRNGQLDILVATDVAARGLDVERISHVLNYDIPYDTESYVHRVGRTGRAGRSGEAILFVSARERHLLRAIERATSQPIEAMTLPSADVVNDQRMAKFKQRITDTLGRSDLAPFATLIESYAGEHGVPMADIATALARMAQGDAPLLLAPDPPYVTAAAPHDKRGRSDTASPRGTRDDTQRRHGARSFDAPREPRGERPFDPRAPRAERSHDAPRAARGERNVDARPPRFERGNDAPRGDHPAQPARPPRKSPDAGMSAFRIEVGHSHGVRPGNIVGALANETGMDSAAIGRIDIRHDYTVVDLPTDLSHEAIEHLQKVWVSGQRLRIRPFVEGGDADGPARPGKPPFRGPKPPPRKFNPKPKPRG
jgi:ATP-dependent RNA helicase DeaD